MTFIDRIIHWNSQRYKQEFNQDLQVSLLREEVDELEDAILYEDILDALVDITYIAIGAMWKLGLSEGQISEAIHIVCDSNATKAVDKVPAHIKANLDKGPNYTPPEDKLKELLNER